MTYYIYHILGVKIGCSNNPTKRVKSQGYSDFEIIEEHTDIIIASNREIELQLQYGYSRDNKPYYQTLEYQKIAVESSNNSDKTKKARLTTGKYIGNLAVESGQLASVRRLTNENRSKGGILTASRIHTCPYCNKTIRGPGYFTWHGTKCKLYT
jgi:hypothetical protein